MAGLRTYVTEEQSSIFENNSSEMPLPTSPITRPGYISLPDSPFSPSSSPKMNTDHIISTMASTIPHPTSPDLTSPTSLYILFTLPFTSDNSPVSTPQDAEATPIAVTNSTPTSAASSPTPSACFSSADITALSPFSSPSLSPVGFVREGRNIHIPYDDVLDDVAPEDVLPEDAIQRRDSYFTFCESKSTLEFHFPVPPRSPVSQYNGSGKALGITSADQISSFEQRWYESECQFTLPQSETEHTESHPDDADAQPKFEVEQDEEDEYCQDNKCFGVDSAVDLDYQQGKKTYLDQNIAVSPSRNSSEAHSARLETAGDVIGLGLGLGIVGLGVES